MNCNISLPSDMVNQEPLKIDKDINNWKSYHHQMNYHYEIILDNKLPKWLRGMYKTYLRQFINNNKGFVKRVQENYETELYSNGDVSLSEKEDIKIDFGNDWERRIF